MTTKEIVKKLNEIDAVTIAILKADGFSDGKIITHIMSYDMEVLKKWYGGFNKHSRHVSEVEKMRGFIKENLV